MTAISHGAAPGGQPWLLGSSLRRLRLATGVVLFTYICLHLLDHALLNLSIGAADAVLLVQKFLWQGLVGTALLYGALVIHPSLGLWALYARRHFRWTRAEAWQLLLGLSVPAMLANHVCVTRLAWSAYGLNKTYVAELHALWIGDPRWGWLQMAVLLVAWIHGCLGLYFLLRLRRWWPDWQTPLCAAAVLLPALALLGFAAGGRELARELAADPHLRTALLPASVTGTAAQKAALAQARLAFLAFYAGAIALILLARLVRHGVEARRGLVSLRYAGGKVVRFRPGASLLDTSRLHDVPHASICGGKGRCSTCRVRVLWSLSPMPPPAAHERAVLAMIGADEDSPVRLACQLHPRADLSVVPLIPPDVAAEFVLGRTPRLPGEERFVAAFFIDLRGSTAIAEQRMPFDSVFLVGKFISGATRAVVSSGGRPVQFLGDGLLALFGLECPPGRACRQALAALRATEAEMAALAALFEQEAGRPLRYGIGLHAGRAIVGEVGFERHVAFTALGETINTAHRLQEVARDMGVAAIVSDILFREADAPVTGWSPCAAPLRGGAGTIAAWTPDESEPRGLSPHPIGPASAAV